MLVIYFTKPDENALVTWFNRDAEQNRTSVSNPMLLSEIPSHLLQQPTYIVIPSTDILLTQVTAPKTGVKKFLQALPYLLEENLADDISELHFAYQMPPEMTSIPIAIIRKSIMNQYISLCTEYGIQPEAIIPDALAIPYIESTYHIVSREDYAICRNSLYSGFSCEENILPFILSQKINSLMEAEKPSNLVVDHENINHVKMLETLGISCKFVKNTVRLVELFANSITRQKYINLLQGDYKPFTKPSITQRNFKIATIFFILFIFVSLSLKISQNIYLIHQNYSQKKQIQTLYRGIFPNTSAVISPRKQLEDELNKLRQSSAENAFFKMLALSGNELAKRPIFKLQSLEFKNNQLNLSIMAPSFADLDNLANALTQAGASVVKNNEKSVSNQVSAELQITAK